MMQAVGPYELHQEIGEGPIAHVYLTKDIAGTPRAVKLLKPDMDESVKNALVSSAHMMAGLYHPHIIRLYDSGEQEGRFFVSLDYAANGSMQPLLKDASVEKMLDVVQQIADALQYAHDRDRVHQNLKPENILFVGESVLLSDFGFALSNRVHPALPQYVSPEQRRGMVIPACDQYALGNILYKWLADVRPVLGSRAEPLNEVIQQARQKDYRQRFASIKDFASAFARSAQA